MQHAPTPLRQEVVLQLVPGSCDLPPNEAHSIGVKSMQVSFSKQQAASTPEQFIGVYADRMTQSPLGVQTLGNEANVNHPLPHTHSVPSIALIKFSPGN